MTGCYAQTELGHGSNIQGFETTFTLDRDNKCFIVNSPRREAYKWWPGSLGVFANHAVTFGLLIIDGQSYGIHGFLVQTRDTKTH